MMGTRPQTLYGLADSPVGLAAWFVDHGDGTGQPGVIGQVVQGERVGELTRDDVLDNITLYWLTNTAVSSARLYWENKVPTFLAVDVSVPTAISVFPYERYQAPRSWAERAYHNLIYYNQLDTRRPLRGLGTATTVLQKRFARASDRCAITEQPGTATVQHPPTRTSGPRRFGTWPGSIIELLAVIDPLTNPTAHGGRSDHGEVLRHRRGSQLLGAGVAIVPELRRHRRPRRRGLRLHFRGPQNEVARHSRSGPRTSVRPSGTWSSR